MYFLKNSECNLKFINYNIFNKIFINKFKISNIYKLVNPVLKLFFLFDKIVDKDYTKLYNYVLIIWLITGKKLKINNLKSRLIKGVRYYSFVYSLYLNNIYYFKFLDFFINIYLPLINKKVSFKQNFCLENSVQYSLFTFQIFSNLRLSNYLYLSLIDKKLFIEFISKKKNEKFLSKYISLLKI